MDKQPLWWQTGVIYQIYPRSFQDSNGDGIGDLGGIITRLDYLRDTLGVDAIWLSPFYPSPMADFGYDISDYSGVHPLFGDLATFDRLVAEAHRRGLAVIIDLVPNHTSDQHPWFLESRSSRTDPKRDWYYWRDPKPDGSPPNNWLSVFGGGAWEWDSKTGQYYLHSFLKEQPDLNWHTPAVKEAIFDVMRFWLERGVDGFRVDVAHLIGKDPALRDNPLNPPPALPRYASRPRGPYDLQHHLYDRGYSPDVHILYREFRQLLDSYSAERPRYSVGEIYMPDPKEWATYYGTNLDELHMPFNFYFIRAPWDAQTIRAIVDDMETLLPPGAWPNYVLGNHDRRRVASRLGPDEARLAAMLLLTLRGTPTLYQGDELGMQGIEIPPERQQDPLGRRMPGHGRDSCRTPMQWTCGINAGFTGANVTPWLPLEPVAAVVNVERELADPRSMLNLHRRLLALRKSSPALKWGGYRSVDGVPVSCFAFLRRTEGEAKLVVLNFSGVEETINLPAFGRGTVKLSTHLDREGPVDLLRLPLRPSEGLVIDIAESV